MRIRKKKESKFVWLNGVIFSLLAVLVIVAPSAQATDFKVEQISENISSYIPEVNSSGQVVWSGYGSTSEIYFYDGSTTIRLTNNYPLTDYNPHINDNGLIVWEHYNGSDWEIMMYDSRATTPVVKSLSNDPLLHDRRPQINSKGQVMWEKKIGGVMPVAGWQIMMSDAPYTTSYEVPLAPTGYSYARPGSYIEPKMNDLGHVVWAGIVEGSRYRRILFYNGTETSIISSNLFRNRLPEINDNDQVVWMGNVLSWDGYQEIFFYDGVSDTQISDNSFFASNRNRGSDLFARINDTGQIVWRAHDSTDGASMGLGFELFLWDSSNGRTQLTTDALNDYAPQINSSGHIAWTSMSGGTGIIKYYDGSAITEFPDYTVSGEGVSLNDNDLIAFGASLYIASRNVNISVIHLATPLTPVAREVTIDFRPDSVDNIINLNAASVKVAILSEDDFDAPAEVDPTSISVGGASVRLAGKSGKSLCSVDDTNGDLLDDLVCIIDLSDSDLVEGDATVTLEAVTYDGLDIYGSDIIQVVP